ncbi:hypothetical protein CW740_07935 [Kangiella profundi]|uniref:GmrSD restriction endonucleases N-terminal domain-containing protein n=1 Tax=Kangiella profundi TaxID=1561924 RepID=A0A2K9A8X2_9GAMM|nr:DUF262 domain-containing protein [Kangiella profundi]AUD79180.1 hypothetical protein CW740_07935 [Kangiella profundi]GGF00830.1 hypothetical protein GCM10011356_13140 [Kangiella profundi]
MDIMQHSSKVHDFTLGEWFDNIINGQIKLPRFQRHEAWDRKRICSFFNTVIHNLPLGVVLVHEVGDTEKFISRYVKTAENNKGHRVTQHLLDGQQRLTAMWRVLHNNYKDYTYFVHINDYDESKELDEESSISVYSRTRYIRKDGRRYPLWCDDPKECLKRGSIPTDLLKPTDISKDLDQWIDEATNHMNPSDDDEDAIKKVRRHLAFKEKLKEDINRLRDRVKHFNLPYLSLPSSTEKDVALQVFINMNTNSKPLSRYDIIVAEVESATGQSLHNLQNKLIEQYPKIARYFDVSFLILAASALLQDRIPNERGMIEMDKALMVENWSLMESCLAKVADFLATQGIYDKQRLPTNAVLGVIAASYQYIPEDGDFRSKAENLLQRYLWSAFFTDRYENSAASRAHVDYRAITSLLKNKDFTEEDLKVVPVLDRSEYPLATAEELETVDWPKRENIRARGILAVTTYYGAYDFADNQPASYESLKKREYHHLYPDALLKDIDVKSYLALNCALITWKTNRVIGRKDPVHYLGERIGWFDKDMIANRLQTHLIDFDDLAKSEYKNLEDESVKEKLMNDYLTFIKKRAIVIAEAAKKLADGNSLRPSTN